MKNIILTVLVLALCVGALMAQPVFGARLGMNLANVSYKDIEDNNSKIGLHLGAMMQYPVNQNIIIQPELLYSMKGVSWDLSSGSNDWSFSYIEIPILAKYNYAMDAIKIQPYIGPSIGILLSAKNNWEFGGASGDTDMKDDLNTIDLGLDIGADVVFMQNFIAGLSYNMGLTNIAKDQPSGSDPVYNRVFMVNLGYLFGN
jgi:hypothetical protein